MTNAGKKNTKDAKGKVSIAIVVPKMPSKIRPENKFSTLLSKVTEYIQAVEEDEDAAYHLRYLKSLQKQLDKKLADDGEINPELLTIHEMLETFIPYYTHERI